MDTKRRLWTPIEDSNRGGLVVGYYRSSGGYTEVHNTAGELIFQDEIGIESVRIPIIDDIVDALKQAGYVAVGLVDAWLQDNWSALGLPPPDRSLASMLGIPRDAVAYRLGRGAGHVLSLLQAAAEMVGGAALILGGGGEFMLGVATTPEGVGLVIMPVAVATIGAGTTVVVHGGALANAVFMSAKGTGTGGAPERKPWKITPEGTAETRVSNKFGRFSKSKSDGLWWSRDTTGHGGSVWKVFAEEPRGLRWKFDANEFGDIITGKHKGATGMFIPWDQLIPVP